MNSRWQFAGWAVAFALSGGALPCLAQPATAANPPAFSSPADGAALNADTSASLPADTTTQRAWRSADAAASLPDPTPDANPAWRQKMLERSQWSLMTPEEIMGVQTPEQIFGLPQEDATATPEQRYLARQDKARLAAGTAAMAARQFEPHDFVGRFDHPDNPLPGLPGDDQNDPAAFSQMFQSTEATPFGGHGGKPSGATAAASAAQKARADQEQAAEMARFRALIGEVQPVATPDFTPPKPAMNTTLPPLSPFDAMGRPVISHLSDLSKPSGVLLPPEIVGYAAPARKVKRPAWAPQPPPWLSDDLNPPSRPPVRKF